MYVNKDGRTNGWRKKRSKQGTSRKEVNKENCRKKYQTNKPHDFKNELRVFKLLEVRNFSIVLAFLIT